MERVVKEWSNELWKMLEHGVPAVWEANGRCGKVPKTTMFFSANLTTEQVEKRLSPAVRSKIALLHTGEKGLCHENLSELCNEVIESAAEVHRYLPSLVGLGK